MSIAAFADIDDASEIGGEDKPSGIADWVAHRIKQLSDKKRAPSHMTYRRVLVETVQPEEFERWMQEYHQKRLKDGLEIVFSMDGKTVRGTIPSGELRGTHLLSIYVPQQDLVLAEAEIDSEGKRDSSDAKNPQTSQPARGNCNRRCDACPTGYF